MFKRICCFGILFWFVSTSEAQLVSTVAGKTDTTGTGDGIGNAATFNSPHGVACDKAGNIYVADRFNHKIRKISSGNIVTTFAGSGNIGGFDGTGTAASFYEPWGIACDTAGNVYVADTKNYKIRKITTAGVVTTIAGTGSFGTTNGPAILARFGFPTGICVTDDGTIYVADHQTHTIRKIFQGNVTTLAGTPYVIGSNDGQGTAASFNRPYGIDLDLNGNILVADEWNHLIREVTPGGLVTTIAGVGIVGSTNGQPMASMFNYPWDVTVDANNNIFIADGYNYTIRKISAGPFPVVSTYVGTAGVSGANNGTGALASFDGATSIAFNVSDFSFYVGDAYNQLIRKITQISTQTISITTNHINNKFCFGDSIVLYANPTNLNNYKFYDGPVLLGTNSTGILVVTSLSPGIHTIQCTAIDGNGATVLSAALQITVSGPIIANINPPGPLTLCIGDTLILSANVGFQYLWSNGKTTQSIIITGNGNFNVVITDSIGCSGQAPIVTVNANPGPTAIISPSGSISICAGDSLMLTASGGATYLWSTGATTTSIQATNPGNYLVTVTDLAGCKNVSLPVTVSFYNVTTATITPGNFVVIITGDSTLLTASSGASYLWSNGATTQTIMASDSGTYIVTVTNSNGCTNVSASVLLITITGNTLVNVLGSTTFCNGDSVLLQSNLATGNQWYFNGAAIAGATGDQYYATVSGYFYDVVTQQNGTSIQSDSILVTVKASPSLPLVTDATICEGEYALLNVQPDSSTIFRWYDQQIAGTLLYTGLVYQTPALSQTTGYFVEATGANGCTNKFREIVQAIVIPKPIADFNHVIQSGGSNGFTVNFNNISGSGLIYFWNFGDSASAENVSFLENPTHYYAVPGSYTVLLIASNQSGCADTIIKVIQVMVSQNIFIPTSFTPNLDGANDLFVVRGPDILQVDMSIYNQWGELIYHAAGANTKWDGRYKGSVVENATYVYAIQLVLSSGITQNFNGHISVIR